MLPEARLLRRMAADRTCIILARHRCSIPRALRNKQGRNISYQKLLLLRRLSSADQSTCIITSNHLVNFGEAVGRSSSANFYGNLAGSKHGLGICG